ncbi:MAG: zinc-dependent alcohol dehydrogenase family protein [Rubrivivax sp.]
MKKSVLNAERFALQGSPTPRCVQVQSCDASLALTARISVQTEERGALSAGEVRVGLLAMTVNPADVLQLDGLYGVKPALPYTPGHEGVAVVLEVADDVSGAQVGDLVLPLAPGGTWRDERVLSSRHVTVVKGDVDILQCAMLSANPVTAWVLLNGIVPLDANACVVQNAANSAVGQCVRQLASATGARLINVVRRADAIDAHRWGDEHWIVDDGLTVDQFRQRVRQMVENRRVGLALDAVAGPSTAKLGASVSEGAKVVVYGLMSEQACQLEPGDLVFRGVQVQGFWLASWFADPGHRALAKTVIPELLGLQQRGLLRMSVAATYDLGSVVGAVEHARRPHRGGKVLLTGAWLSRLHHP